MKDGLVLLAAICLALGIMIFGIVRITQIQYAPPEKTNEELIRAAKKKRAYKQNIQDVEQRRKDLLRQQKQRLRDMQRR